MVTNWSTERFFFQTQGKSSTIIHERLVNQSNYYEQRVSHYAMTAWDRLYWHYEWLFFGKIEIDVWPLNLEFMLDVMTWRYMRDPYTDNNFIIILLYSILLLTRPAFKILKLFIQSPSNDPQSSLPQVESCPVESHLSISFSLVLLCCYYYYYFYFY